MRLFFRVQTCYTPRQRYATRYHQVEECKSSRSYQSFADTPHVTTRLRNVRVIDHTTGILLLNLSESRRVTRRGRDAPHVTTRLRNVRVIDHTTGILFLNLSESRRVTPLVRDTPHVTTRLRNVARVGRKMPTERVQSVSVTPLHFELLIFMTSPLWVTAGLWSQRGNIWICVPMVTRMLRKVRCLATLNRFTVPGWWHLLCQLTTTSRSATVSQS